MRRNLRRAFRPTKILPAARTVEPVARENYPGPLMAEQHAHDVAHSFSPFAFPTVEVTPRGVDYLAAARVMFFVGYWLSAIGYQL